MGAGESGMLSPGPPTHGPLARAAGLRGQRKPIGSVPCHYFPRVRLAIRATCAPVRPGRIGHCIQIRPWAIRFIIETIRICADTVQSL